MIRILIFLAISLVLKNNLSAQIILPEHANDAYSSFVKQLENKNFNIDFTAFRFSFLNSPQYAIANEQHKENIELMKSIKEKVREENYEAAIPLLEKALSLDYSFLGFHFHLRNAYVAMEKESLAQKHHEIYSKLAESLIKTTNGENCNEAFKINHIKEAYFLIEYFQYKLLEKPSISEYSDCEIFHIKAKDNTEKYIFFDISDIIKKYEELGLSRNR